MITYAINLYQIAKNLLPHFLQKKTLLGWITADNFFWVTASGESWDSGAATRHLDWLKALMAPIQSLNAELQAFVTDVRYRLTITGQVIYLEHYLNDLYDPIDRRIYIEDGNPIAPVFLYNKSETAEDVVIYNKSESELPVYLVTKAEDVSNVDFIIVLPYDTDTTPILIDKVKASTNIYKPAGRRYSIQSTDGGPIWSE